jgi:hypothetical protein
MEWKGKEGRQGKTRHGITFLPLLIAHSSPRLPPLFTHHQYGVYLLLVLAFWGTPLLRLSPSATWPLSSFFAFPRLGPGAVGVSAAIAMVKAATAPLGPWLTTV